MSARSCEWVAHFLVRHFRHNWLTQIAWTLFIAIRGHRGTTAAIARCAEPTCLRMKRGTACGMSASYESGRDMSDGWIYSSGCGRAGGQPRAIVARPRQHRPSIRRLVTGTTPAGIPGELYLSNGEARESWTSAVWCAYDSAKAVATRYIRQRLNLVSAFGLAPDGARKRMLAGGAGGIRASPLARTSSGGTDHGVFIGDRSHPLPLGFSPRRLDLTVSSCLLTYAIESYFVGQGPLGACNFRFERP